MVAMATEKTGVVRHLMSVERLAGGTDRAETEGRDENLSLAARLRNEKIRERVQLLGHAPLFSVLQPGDLDLLASKFYDVAFQRGEMLFRYGEPSERLFLIEKGRVKLTIPSPSGNELFIGILGRGEIFGELSIIDRGPRAMSARAMEDSAVVALGGDVFWTLLEDHPAFARRLLELMARRLRRADERSQDLVFFDAPTRLARKLLELAEEHGEAAGAHDEIKIGVKVTQEEMAQMIGVSRGSVNRLLATFAGQGWITWNDGCPVLLRPEAIMRRAR